MFQISLTTEDIHKWHTQWGVQKQASKFMNGLTDIGFFQTRGAQFQKKEGMYYSEMSKHRDLFQE